MAFGSIACCRVRGSRAGWSTPRRSWSRRRRQAKTDKIDGETLVRTLLAYKRGEPRVCSMVKAPTPEEEDRRRICRERKTLTAERVEHINRIKGLLFAQGIGDYQPLRRNRRMQLEELKTGDGRPLPTHLKKQITRELDRLEIILAQLKAVEAERDALLEPRAEQASTPAMMIAQLRESALSSRASSGPRDYSALRQPKAAGSLRGSGAHALAERIGQTRAGSVQVRQSQAADDHGTAGLALAKTPAWTRR